MPKGTNIEKKPLFEPIFCRDCGKKMYTRFPNMWYRRIIACEDCTTEAGIWRDMLGCYCGDCIMAREKAENYRDYASSGPRIVWSCWEHYPYCTGYYFDSEGARRPQEEDLLEGWYAEGE